MTSGHAPGDGLADRGPTSAGSTAYGQARTTLDTPQGSFTYYRLDHLREHGIAATALERLPITIKIFLENLLRKAGNGVVRDSEIESLARWDPTATVEGEVPFYPARVLLQDFTGVPAAVDLAAMRSAMARLGGDPKRINPLVPADLVIDHSVQVDYFGSSGAFELNVEREYERNQERYALLRWTQQAFENFRVVPPGRGIVHQVNLEYLASVMFRRSEGGETFVYPDSLVRLTHHDGERSGCAGLGRRRYRSRGGFAWPAALLADSGSGWVPLQGRAARGNNGH
jgi:aconitate hydratase